MTLKLIDRRRVTLHMSEIHSFQQVVLSHRGLFIDRPLNVRVVLIDPPRSLQAASRKGAGELQGTGT